MATRIRRSTINYKLIDGQVLQGRIHEIKRMGRAIRCKDEYRDAVVIYIKYNSRKSMMKVHETLEDHAEKKLYLHYGEFYIKPSIIRNTVTDSYETVLWLTGVDGKFIDD